MGRVIATALLLTFLFQTFARAKSSDKDSGLTTSVSITTFVAHRDNTSRYNYDDPGNISGAQLANSAIANNATITFKFKNYVNTKSFGKWTYGAMIDLNADTSRSESKEQDNASSNGIYLQNDKIGRFEFGNLEGAGGILDLTAENFLKGTYSHDGHWASWIGTKTSKRYTVISGAPTMSLDKSNLMTFIRRPSLITRYITMYYSHAQKINFYTKPLKGLLLGVSYIPDLDSNGTVANLAPKNKGPVDKYRKILGQPHPATFKEIVSGGIRYGFDVAGVKIESTIAGEKGRAKLSNINPLRSWEVGSSIKYKSFGVSSSYGKWGKSLTLRSPYDNTKQYGAYYTLSAMHDISDKMGYSISYMKSKRAGGMEIVGQVPSGLTQSEHKGYSDKKANALSNITLDVDYKIIDGFALFAGISKFHFKEAQNSKGNSGHIILCGTKIKI